MQVGSKVICIKGFENTFYGFFMSQIFNSPLPEKDKTYIIRAIQRCNCNQHDNLSLEEINNWWNANHFRELIPPANIDEVLEEIFKKEKVHERHLEEVH